MNNRMRKSIRALLDELREVIGDADEDAVQAAQRILEELALILEENQDILDNYPEGLQDSERVQAQIEAQSVMEESLGNLSSYMEEGGDYDVEDALMEIDEFEEAVEY